MSEENNTQTESTDATTTKSSEQNTEDPRKEGILSERGRILTLLEITDDFKELKKFIETDLDPSKAALQVLKKIRSAKETHEPIYPKANMSGSNHSSKANETLLLAKKYGVIK